MGVFRERRTRGDLARLLIGEDIENPGNADCLRAAASMFEWQSEMIEDADELRSDGVPIIALENASGAEDLFKFRPPEGPFALVVGNERKGISREMLRRADRVVQIPVRSRHVNCLNVAAAAAVAMHRLAGRAGQLATRGGRSGGRPTIAFAGVADAIELGSAVRSAACFGWDALHVVDPHGAWFDADRATRSLGRGAARRARNPIRVAPLREGRGAFDEICVIGTEGEGEPLRRTDLARGPRQLVVFGDVGCIGVAGERVRPVRVEVAHGAYPFRLVASIALAEIMRQVG